MRIKNARLVTYYMSGVKGQEDNNQFTTYLKENGISHELGILPRLVPAVCTHRMVYYLDRPLFELRRCCFTKTTYTKDRAYGLMLGVNSVGNRRRNEKYSYIWI